MKPLSKVCLTGVLAFIAFSGIYLAAQDLSAKSVPAAPGSAGAGQAGEKKGRAARNSEITVKVASSQAVLAYLKAPGQRTLAAALETCLAAREKLADDLLNDFFLAFCYHEAGDAAGEARALAAHAAEQQDMYRYIFYEHRAELADSLYLLPAYICRQLRESANAAGSFPAGAKCPCFGGPVSVEQYRGGKRAHSRYLCPKCDEMLGLQERKMMGNELLRVKENSLNSILFVVAAFHKDRRRGGPGQAGPDSYLDLFGIREGQVLADIGCGIGEYTFSLARMAGPKGKVYAEDIDPNAVGLIKYCVAKGGIKNIEPVLGTPTEMGIPPGTLDTAVLMNVYRGMAQELDSWKEADREAFYEKFFAGIRKTLKKDGALVLFDSLDPAFDVSVKKVAAELRKRNFRLVSDKSPAGDRRLILIFKIATPDGKAAGGI